MSRNDKCVNKAFYKFWLTDKEKKIVNNYKIKVRKSKQLIISKKGNKKVMGKYFRWGLVGNTLIFGGSMACVAYVGWILWDLNENHSVKISAKLYKETFQDATQEDYNEIIRRGKAK